MSDISITKEAAAQRQIDAAIRMFFLHREDLIAVHTVAAAARNVVKDLAHSKGVGYLSMTRGVLEQMLREALAAVTRSSETGDALEEVHRDTLVRAAHSIVKDTAERMGDGTGVVHLEPDDLDPMNPKIAADLDRRARAIESDKRTGEYRRKGENFLKHADYKYHRSAEDKFLNPADLDTLWVIADAINLWTNLNLPFTDEMWVYSCWLRGITAEKPEEFINTKAGPIHLFTFEQQVDFGRWLLKLVYLKAGRSLEQFRDDAAYSSVSINSLAVRMFTALD